MHGIYHCRTEHLPAWANRCWLAQLSTFNLSRASLSRYLWLSVAAAVVTIGFKYAAYYVTDSVGLLSDALESLVNLAAALIALGTIRTAARPPDDAHAYGHDKAEYFSSGAEGILILAAALGIGWSAFTRFYSPQPIQNAAVGLTLSALASSINLVVGLVLVRRGRARNSIALEADGQHLLSDVLAASGVFVGVLAVSITSWAWLDPAVALAVATYIVWTGFQLVQRSARGLLDPAFPEIQLEQIRDVLNRYGREQSVLYHALRTRQSGARKFMSVHILVPDDWTVRRGHDLCTAIERELYALFPEITINTHLEPVNDPTSWKDLEVR